MCLDKIFKIRLYNVSPFLLQGLINLFSGAVTNCWVADRKYLVFEVCEIDPTHQTHLKVFPQGVLALTLTNLKVFLQDKYWNEKMTPEKVKDKLYTVISDTCSVKWFHEPTNLKPYQSQRKHYSVSSYIEARDGKIKSIEQEISDILR